MDVSIESINGCIWISTVSGINDLASATESMVGMITRGVTAVCTIGLQ